MINPLYQQMVVRVANQQLMPMTKDNNLTRNDLQILVNQSPNMPEHVTSAISFLLNTFESLSIAGDKEPSGISKQDIDAFSKEGVNLSIEA